MAPLRARRAGIAAVAAIGALAVAAPSANAADATPPSTPTDAILWHDIWCGVTTLSWQVSTDNVDTREQLRYLFYDAEGRQISAFPGATEVHLSTADTPHVVMPRSVHTMRAVDRAGNVSDPAVVRLVNY